MEVIDTEDPKSFSDGLSKREFFISGLCQRCQDKVFEIDLLNDDIEYEDGPFFPEDENDPSK
ncbi:MAG TPA: hypothetical protein VJ508_05875 [Saprospiraceae bacterium]|nr:hypothetical protein [Saprospiraceae bacterium]